MSCPQSAPKAAGPSVVCCIVLGTYQGGDMCWACDNPGGDPLRNVHELMLRHGWAVQGVERHRDHPPWAYTVGLTEAGLPELVVTGMHVADACDLLNDVAHHVVHAEPPVPGSGSRSRAGRWWRSCG